MKGTIITTDGLAVKREIATFEDAQKIVGGWIEVVHLPKNKVLLVDEEGLCKAKACNPQASALAQQYLVGTAIMIDEKFLN